MVGQVIANEQNAKQAKENRNWQADMSNTSHQREVADLKAAGLNPILSANAGASTPGGAMATMESVTEKGVTSAIEASTIKANLEKMRAETQALKSQDAKTRADEALSQAARKKVDMETTVLSKDLPKAEVINRIYQKAIQVLPKMEEGMRDSAKMPSLDHESRHRANVRKWQQKYGNSKKIEGLQ